MDSSITIPDPSDKNYSDITEHITFTQQPVSHADDAFIDFIRTETGKIRPLAESDLDSFLSDGKILLNIGKPFHIEGIGHLQKNRSGSYDFTPAAATLQKPATAAASNESHEEPAKSRSFYSDETGGSAGTRKTLAIAGVLAGVILVVWLGYVLYNRHTTAPKANADSVTVAPDENNKANTILDSVQNKIDSVRASSNNSNTTNQSYRFVIEKGVSKNRAYRRYNQIKESMADVRMETRDSTFYSLYFLLPAQPADTARIRDSLKIWYGRKRVWVEDVSPR